MFEKIQILRISFNCTIKRVAKFKLTLIDNEIVSSNLRGTNKCPHPSDSPCH